MIHISSKKAILAILTAITISFAACEADTGISGKSKSGDTQFRVTKTESLDASGNLLEYTVSSYNSKGQKTSDIVFQPDGSVKASANSGIHHLYSYDANGNLTKDDTYMKDVNGDKTVDATNDATYQYIYTAYEFDANGLKSTESMCVGSAMKATIYQSTGSLVDIGTPFVKKTYTYDSSKRTSVISVRGYLNLVKSYYATEATKNFDIALSYADDKSIYPSGEKRTFTVNGLGNDTTLLSGTSISPLKVTGVVMTNSVFSFKGTNMLSKQSAQITSPITKTYSITNWTYEYKAIGTSTVLSKESSVTGSSSDPENFSGASTNGSYVKYTYNKNGLNTEKTTYDAAGNVTEQYVREYDSRDNLKKETYYNAGAFSTCYKYSYDYKK